MRPPGGRVAYTIGYTGEVPAGDRNVVAIGLCDTESRAG